MSWARRELLGAQRVEEGAASGHLHINMYGPSREPLKGLEDGPEKSIFSARLTRNTSFKHLLGLESIKPPILTYPPPHPRSLPPTLHLG